MVIMIINIDAPPSHNFTHKHCAAAVFASPRLASVLIAYPLPQKILIAYSSTTFLPLFFHTSARRLTTASLLRGFVDMFVSALAGLLGFLSGNICITGAENQHHS